MYALFWKVGMPCRFWKKYSLSGIVNYMFIWSFLSMAPSLLTQKIPNHPSLSSPHLQKNKYHENFMLFFFTWNINFGRKLSWSGGNFTVKGRDLALICFKQLISQRPLVQSVCGAKCEKWRTEIKFNTDETLDLKFTINPVAIADNFGENLQQESRFGFDLLPLSLSVLQLKSTRTDRVKFLCVRSYEIFGGKLGASLVNEMFWKLCEMRNWNADQKIFRFQKAFTPILTNRLFNMSKTS